MDALGVRDLQVEGKRVFVRVDFNVPMDGERVVDDTRIRASLPTLSHLRASGGRLIVASHLGRPKGKVKPEYSLRPAAARLGELLGCPVGFTSDCIGSAAEAAARGLADGEVLLLENLRFHAGEEANDAEFAARLAALAEIYVNDAFGTCHRAHASIVGITGHLEKAAAGFLLGREIEGLSRATRDPKPPFLLLVGGAKVSDKIPVIEGLLTKLDHLAIGGAMAYTFLRAMGVAVGRSRVEEDKLEVAGRTLEAAEKRGVEVSIPVDHVAAGSLESDAEPVTVESDAFPADLMGLDIGPITVGRYREAIQGAGTIVWNGPMGVFEKPAYASGTLEVAKAVADSAAYSVVGGGDSVAALAAAGVTERIGHVSTGGGASLQFLAGKTLPGLAALSAKGT